MFIKFYEKFNKVIGLVKQERGLMYFMVHVLKLRLHLLVLGCPLIKNKIKRNAGVIAI